MPIYEYRCADCGAKLEKMQKVSDAPLTVCEKCGGRLEKQWSLSGFQFKGEGWYVTDYSNKSKTAKSGEKKSATESTAKTETASNKANDSTTNSSKSSEKAEK